MPNAIEVLFRTSEVDVSETRRVLYTIQIPSLVRVQQNTPENTRTMFGTSINVLQRGQAAKGQVWPRRCTW
ncbi:hypothetical protein [Thermus phage P23-45]|uniref:Uncharacterized protein n=1 Tax=Thermus virus P23-45 TaxID=2914006 RepID=A7XXF4_BP234|nr:hypothetical protein P23p116 [Thermus phage P23-45]ABU96949.1 hypothetical protein P23p116 [Thermus phage P23-45]UYB98475.1 hypothetical protein [Thermus phage P23-45]